MGNNKMKTTHKAKPHSSKNNKSQKSNQSKGLPKKIEAKSHSKDASKAKKDFDFKKKNSFAHAHKSGVKGAQDKEKKGEVKKSSHFVSANSVKSQKKEVKLEVSSFKKEHLRKQELKKKEQEKRDFQKAKEPQQHPHRQNFKGAGGKFSDHKNAKKGTEKNHFKAPEKNRPSSGSHESVKNQQAKEINKGATVAAKVISKEMTSHKEPKVVFEDKDESKNKKQDSKAAVSATSKDKKSKNTKPKEEDELDDAFLSDDEASEIEEYAEDLKAVEEADLEVDETIIFETEVKEKNFEEINLTDAEGNLLCRARDCDQIANVDGYCRYHYLLYWKKIQVRKKILTDGKLERYVEELTSRYPDKFLEMIRRDLRTQKDFVSAIQELEIDESNLENEFEEDTQTYIDEVRGINEATSIDDEFE
ncbi:MAG: hypothetical protein HUU56_03950 [Bdellovibrionaceae bacterium]|nr:hypothetical protein [Pseudobdellovibrionaceae bacterium]